MAESEWIRNGQLDSEAVVPALESFLGMLIRGARLEVRAEVHRPESRGPAGEGPPLRVNLDGPDGDLLLERQGELLRALEHLTLRWLRLPPEFHDQIRFDCRDYKAARLAELRLAAETAAARVKQSRQPYRFNPMNSHERRVLHLALKDDPAVRTVSEGEGRDRAVVIYPA